MKYAAVELLIFEAEANMGASHYIVIVGCGRLGSILANRLSEAGHQIVVIDSRNRAFDALSVEFTGYKITGDAIEPDVLRQAGVKKADYVFATTTEDNVNIMVAQVARRIFGVPHVVARVYDPAREEIYRGLGIATVSPTHLTADAFLEILSGKKDFSPDGVDEGE